MPIFAPQVTESSPSNSSSCDTVLEILYILSTQLHTEVHTYLSYLIAFYTSISLHFTPLSHCISHLYLIAFHTSILLHFAPVSPCISHLASLVYPYMCKTSQHCSHPPNILLFSLQPPDCCTNTTKENKLAYGWFMYSTNVCQACWT